MNRQSYRYGMKLTGLLLHIFFSVMLAISLSLLISLLDMDVLQSSDIGMEDFLRSGYNPNSIGAKCVEIAIIGAIASAIGWMMALIYLTLATGMRETDQEIHLNRIDGIKTELLTLAFAVCAGKLAMLLGQIGIQEWNISGILVASGTLSFILDVLFLIFYLSMVRRLKAETLWKNSLLYFLLHVVRTAFLHRTLVARILAAAIIHCLAILTLAAGAFYYGSRICLLLLILLCSATAYLMLRQETERYEILKSVMRIADGHLSDKINVDEMHGGNRKLAEAINNIGAGLLHAVDDNTKNERMKADLITNVSHDIKTPLTSIINYVNLIKLEPIENARVLNYVNILDDKSQRLKQLTEDLVEASRISSGNVRLDMARIDLVELICQTGGECNEKFEDKELTIITKLPNHNVFILADGRHLYRVIENLYNNVAKYALAKTRVYVEVQTDGTSAKFSIKNISARALETDSAEELTERFVRGDSSRSTEGSGLGLSIAKNLTILMGGTFEIFVNGDLFTVNLAFPLCPQPASDP